MAKFRASRDEHYSPNVWPAFTDAILLMASIFIVLSVVSMMSMAQKFYDYEEPDEGDSQTVCFLISLPSDGLLFATGDADLLVKGKGAIKQVLPVLAERVAAIKAHAKSQEWSDYYIILEASGHTDNDPRSGTPHLDGNWELANDRANAVIDLIQRHLKQPQHAALAKKLGIKSGKATPGSTILRASGYSHHLPVKNLKHKKQNRRVEIRLFAQPVDMVQVRK